MYTLYKRDKIKWIDNYNKAKAMGFCLETNMERKGESRVCSTSSRSSNIA